VGDLKVIHSHKNRSDPVQQFCDCWGTEDYWPHFNWYEDNFEGIPCTYVLCTRCHETYFAGAIPPKD